jgi:iron complex outermembrane receptor protein
MLLVAASAPAWAEAEPPREGEEEIVHAGTERVEVTGEGAVAGEAPTTFATIIRPEEHEGRVAGLADLLGESVGVRVRSFGGLHSFATVSIRGSTAEQVMVFVDGVPLNNPIGGAVNLADVPLAGVEAIEVYRGFAPASLGASSIGGAVNIRTRSPSSELAASGSVAYGSYETGEITAQAHFGEERMRWSLSAEGFSTEGSFDYLDNNGTHITTADDGFNTRANNDRWSAAVRVRGETDYEPGRRLSVSAEWLRRREGVPGIDAFQSADAGFSLQRGLMRAQANWDALAGGRVAIEAAADYEYTSESFTDVETDNIGPGPQDTVTRVSGAGGRFRLLWNPSPLHRLSVLLEPRVQWAGSRDRLNEVADSIRATRTLLTAVIEDEAHLAGGMLILAPSLRFDHHDTRSRGGAPGDVTEPAGDPAAFSGRLGALLTLSPRWSLRGNIGVFNRVPGLLELYGNEGTIVGNPELVPERGVNADVGATFHGRGVGVMNRLRMELVAFRTDADDLIRLRPLPTLNVKAMNTGRARITGVEASVSLRLSDRLTASANYTRQKPIDLSDTFEQGGDLPGRPREELSTLLDLSLERVTLYHRFSYIGENNIGALGEADENLPEDRRGLTMLPARYLHDAGVRVRLGTRSLATLEVANILDRHIVDVARYPLPGRTIFLKLSGSF